MSETVSPDELLDDLEGIDIDIPDKIATGVSAEIGQHVNLNAIAIGLGLESVVYEPERFSGLIYTPEEYDETVAVLFRHGILFVAGTVSAEVMKTVDDVMDQLEGLGLIDEAEPVDLNKSPEEIAVPEEYEQSDDLGGAGEQISCPSCDRELSGDENYCPGCGVEL